MSRFTFTSESVSEGHPDKVCDYISDSVLDACLEQDPKSRVACETLVKSDHVVLAGEITTNAKLDFDAIVRKAVKEIGYTDTSEPFCDTTLKLLSLITKQSNEISQGVTEATSQSGDQGAGDQGIMFGYACNETPDLMPAPIFYAHKILRLISEARHAGREKVLGPDSKSQVTVQYENGKPVENSYLDASGAVVTGCLNTNRRASHDPEPKWILGHSSYLTFHNFDFSFTLRAYLGNFVYNNVASNLGTYQELNRASPYNLHASVLETGFTSPQYLSDFYVEDASFLRMVNLTAGYSFAYRGQQLRVYGSLQNVFTLTGYSGVDPTAGLIGIDNNIYPRSRTFTGGLSVRF